MPSINNNYEECITNLYFIISFDIQPYHCARTLLLYQGDNKSTENLLTKGTTKCQPIKSTIMTDISM